MVKSSASPLAKSDLVQAVRGALGPRGREARLVVDRAFDAIVEAVGAGERVELRGIGTFRRKVSPPRWARDFRSGRPVRVAGAPRVSFRISRTLRAALNAASSRADAA